MNLQTMNTPSLVLDYDRVERNAERMSRRVRDLGASLRPHVKTHKCIEVARLQTRGHTGGITVSTLAEARAFAAHEFRDITYAVPIEPGKFAAACQLARSCEGFSLITDELETARELNERARREGLVLNLFLKVDCGYHRCGVEPESAAALEIPRFIADASHLHFKGILTHAGHSYHARSGEELLSIARHERDVMTELAERLRDAGVAVEVTSIGSTPTITQVDQLSGITEARPGNYIFFDAFQATLGSCRFEDCALTVLTAVVHRDRSRRKIVIDAGSIALSKDRGAVELDPQCGYGRVLDLAGAETGLRVAALSQEHGEIIAADDEMMEMMEVGTRLRVLANHSCLTAAQHSHYNILQGDEIVDRWEIRRGW